LGKRYQAQGDTKTAHFIYRAASKMLPNNRELHDSLQMLSDESLSHQKENP
jgi:hypothetical protein